MVLLIDLELNLYWKATLLLGMMFIVQLLQVIMKQYMV